MGKQGEEWVGACQAAPLRKQSHKKENQGDMEKDEGKEREGRSNSRRWLIVLDGWRLRRRGGHFPEQRATQNLGFTWRSSPSKGRYEYRTALSSCER